MWVLEYVPYVDDSVWAWTRRDNLLTWFLPGINTMAFIFLLFCCNIPPHPTPVRNTPDVIWCHASTESCSNDYRSKGVNVMSPKGLLLLNCRNFCFLLEAEPTTSGNIYNPRNLSGHHHFSISIRILETKSHNNWKIPHFLKNKQNRIAWLSSLIFSRQCRNLVF